MNNKTTLVLLLSAAACATAIACTTEPTPAGKADSNATAKPGSGGSNGGPGAGDGNGGNNGAPAGGTVVRTGVITMSQTIVFIPTQDDMAVVSAFAMFSEATSAATTPKVGASNCTTSTEGDCSIIVCDLSGATGGTVGDAGAGGGTAKKLPSAGEIALTGLRDTKLMPGAQGTYAPLSESDKGPLWNDEDGITVKAAGAEVPAFEKNLKGASSITVTSPEWPDSPASPLEIDRSADLEITWEGGTAGEVRVSATTAADKKSAIMTCTFKADSGTGTITTAALGKMLAGSGTFGLSAINNETVTAGDWKVSISVSGTVTAATGTMGALATFQ